MADFQYKDVYDFQNKHKTKEEREKVLAQMDDSEIWHIATTCGNATASAYYSGHMKDPTKFRRKEN